MKLRFIIKNPYSIKDNSIRDKYLKNVWGYISNTFKLYIRLYLVDTKGKE